MALEIERKFLVSDNQWRAQIMKRIQIKQGYLSTEIHCPIRVRIAGSDACITIKGKPVGMIRAEYEYPIPMSDAEQMLEHLCKTVIIEKTRATIRHDGIEWVVDEFAGHNSGLIVAEVELDDPGQTVEIPAWVGKEITDDHRYSNSQLAVKPYTSW
jgi:adenylate cyclase